METDKLQQLVDQIVAYGDSRFRDGVRLSILEMETFRGWLTMPPDTKRQQEQRRWVDVRIAKLKEVVGG